MHYELKARSTGEILDAAFTLYRNHFVEFFQVALTVAAPLALLRLAVVHGITGVWAMDSTPAMGQQNIMTVAVATLPIMLGVYGLQHAALVSVVSDTYLGRASMPWARTVSVIPSILGAGLISGFGVGLGFLFLIVPGFILMLRWALSTQVIVIEGRGAWASLSRSGVLMEGRSGKVALLLLVVGLLSGVLVGGLNMLLPASLKAVPLIPQLLALVLTTVVSPLGPCVMTLAYFDARVEKEAFDLEMLATAMGKTQSGQPMIAPQG